MSGEEISRLTKALSELGVCKIRLTGGEPTVRKDFFDILKDMKQNSNIPKITMTTNGYRLNKIAKQLHELGLDGINISIDSLNRETFKKLTGHDRLPEILAGIKILQDLNFKNILGIEPAKNLAKNANKNKIKTFNGFLNKKNTKKIKKTF